MVKKIIIIAVVVMLLMSIGMLAACSNFEPYPDEYFSELRAEDNTAPLDANVRIMSSNVLVHIKSWGGEPVDPRAQMYAETIKHYQPDVVGLQEFCGCWYNKLPKQIPDYKLLKTAKSDYTTMMYNTKTVELVEQGKMKYSKESNKNCRFIIWGLFKRLTDGSKFIVTTTHWDFGVDEKKTAMRDIQVKEHATLVDELMTKYDCPVIATGDYNAEENDIAEGAKFYNDFLAASSMTNPKFADGVIRKALTSGSYDEPSLDHILIKGNVQPLLFNVLYNDYYKILSDHASIYLDAII